MDNKALQQEGIAQMPIPAELCQIKDYAVLIEMAGAYLCEEVIVNKLAEEIEKNLKGVKEYVSQIRRQLVGKPLYEVDIKGPYNNIQQLAMSLRCPDEFTKQGFKEGRVGKALMEATREMAEAIEELVERVEGKPKKYRKKDLFIQAYERLKHTAYTIVTTSKFLTKILVGLGVLCLVVFVVLYGTMETQEDVLAQVRQVKASIEEKQNNLAEVSRLISQLRDESQKLEQKQEGLSREDKIKLLELKLREHNLKQKKERIQFELNAQRDLLDKNLKRLQEIKSTSFLSRLLRLS